ncbi:MAG TPA: NAD-dependent epimerase/dehydratase family protein, partial [Gemmatimonadaceae bacterium]|nr:NAD-dependent epimerase/dehydratase family protein [Gemmatimonadaceae bacterium]
MRRALTEHPRTWLVTGAAGFIGSNLVEELLALGQTVVGLDDFSTGKDANLTEALARTGGSSSAFRFIEGDIRHPAACRAACEGVDFVLHHAALASVPESIANPVANSQVNVEGFLNVLVAARDARVSRVVYASSSAVYGDTTHIPQVESVVGELLSPYAASKAANELYATTFLQAYGLASVGLRYFNVFGKRQDPNGAYAAVIPRWIANLLSEVPCEIFGDGNTTRDFLYVADVVQANILAATADAGRARGVFNVACGQETSLNDLFQLIRRSLARLHPGVHAAAPRHAAARGGDIRRSVADI